MVEGESAEQSAASGPPQKFEGYFLDGSQGARRADSGRGGRPRKNQNYQSRIAPDQPSKRTLEQTLGDLFADLDKASDELKIEYGQNKNDLFYESQRDSSLQSSRITFRLRGRMRRARRCLQKTETRGFRASVGSVFDTSQATRPGWLSQLNPTLVEVRFKA